MPIKPGNHRPKRANSRLPLVVSRWGQGRGGSGWRATRKRIFERDGYLCQIHRSRGMLRAVALHGPNHGICDHKVALAHGGSGDDSNLQTICQDCNKSKTQAESNGRGIA